MDPAYTVAIFATIGTLVTIWLSYEGYKHCWRKPKMRRKRRKMALEDSGSENIQLEEQDKDRKGHKQPPAPAAAEPSQINQPQLLSSSDTLHAIPDEILPYDSE